MSDHNIDIVDGHADMSSTGCGDKVTKYEQRENKLDARMGDFSRQD